SILGEQLVALCRHSPAQSLADLNAVGLVDRIRVELEPGVGRRASVLSRQGAQSEQNCIALLVILLGRGLLFPFLEFRGLEGPRADGEIKTQPLLVSKCFGDRERDREILMQELDVGPNEQPGPAAERLLE